MKNEFVMRDKFYSKTLETLETIVVWNGSTQIARYAWIKVLRRRVSNINLKLGTELYSSDTIDTR